MKCIKPTKKNIDNGGNPEEVVRVPDKQAKQAVDSGMYQYTNKETWKQKGRQ